MKWEKHLPGSNGINSLGILPTPQNVWQKGAEGIFLAYLLSL